MLFRKWGIIFWKERCPFHVYNGKTGCREVEGADSYVRILCVKGKVSGITREGRNWMIPTDARKVEDRRFKATESLLTAIDGKKK